MPEHPRISDRLRDRAVSHPSEAAALETAATKLESYAKAPADLKAAAKIASVLTPAVVDALGEAFVALRTDELTGGPDPIWGYEFQQADHAFAALLIGAATPELSDVALARLEDVSALLPRLAPQQAEHIHYLTSDATDLDVAVQLHSAAAERLAQEPPTLGERWADELGLDLPREHWSLTLGIPLAWPGAKKLSDHPLDGTVWADVANYPGDRTRWNIRIGTLGRDRLGENNASPVERGVPLGQFRREDLRGDQVIAGAIAPAESPFDFPRVLADLEAADPVLRFDLKRLSVSGGPGRLGSAARKKALREWLGRDLGRG